MKLTEFFLTKEDKTQKAQKSSVNYKEIKEKLLPLPLTQNQNLEGCPFESLGFSSEKRITGGFNPSGTIGKTVIDKGYSQDKEYPALSLHSSDINPNITQGASGSPILKDKTVVGIYHYRGQGIIPGPNATGQGYARPMYCILDYIKQQDKAVYEKLTIVQLKKTKKVFPIHNEKVFVNRKKELREFQDFLNSSNQNILYYYSISGRGKSWLLSKFRDCCDCHLNQIPCAFIDCDRHERQIPYAFVDFKSTSYSYISILIKIMNSLDNTHFSSFNNLITSYSGSIYMGILNSPVVKDPAVIDAVTENFISCLAQLLEQNKIILLFDSIERMDDITLKWFCNKFLIPLSASQIKIVLGGIKLSEIQVKETGFEDFLSNCGSRLLWKELEKIENFQCFKDFLVKFDPRFKQEIDSDENGFKKVFICTQGEPIDFVHLALRLKKGLFND